MQPAPEKTVVMVRDDGNPKGHVTWPWGQEEAGKVGQTDSILADMELWRLYTQAPAV